MRTNDPLTNVFKKNNHKSEVVTQLLYGETFKKIKKVGAWIKIKNDIDNYKGFIKFKNFLPNQKNTHKVSILSAKLYSSPNSKKKIDMDFEDFKGVYIQAFELGCKGCTTYRPNDITGAVLERKSVEQKEVNLEPELPLEPPAKTSRPSDIGDSGAVAHLFKPLDRPGELPGKTYKLKWPESDHAIYITLNDILDEFGRIRPFEIFINSKKSYPFLDFMDLFV